MNVASRRGGTTKNWLSKSGSQMEPRKAREPVRAGRLGNCGSARDKRWLFSQTRYCACSGSRNDTVMPTTSCWNEKKALAGPGEEPGDESW